MSNSFNIEEDDAKLIIHPNYTGTSLILEVEDDGSGIHLLIRQSNIIKLRDFLNEFIEASNENRGILYRAIPDDKLSFGNWVYGSLIDMRPINGDSAGVYIYTELGKIKVIPETVGQFTGAFGIGEIGIFQHCIVLDRSTQRKFKIIRSKFFAEFVMEDLETGGHVPINFQISRIRFEVTGTIHDHLLEANNE